MTSRRPEHGGRGDYRAKRTHEVIDAELRLIVAVRWSIRENGT
jgi:hypothetical protein